MSLLLLKFNGFYTEAPLYFRTASLSLLLETTLVFFLLPSTALSPSALPITFLCFYLY